MHQTETEDGIIAQALLILARRCAPGAAMCCPTDVRNFLTVRAANHRREVFAVLFLDMQNRVLSCEDLFFGTLSQTSVYPREVVRRCIELGAAGVIFTHNHPSGSTKPSRADEQLTVRLRTALDLIDVRVVDHVITAGGEYLSMAEAGLI